MPLPERELIAELRRLAGFQARKRLSSGQSSSLRQTASHLGFAIVAGIGDDCAVLRMGQGSNILVTTDFSLEGIHFRRDWHSPESIGHRCLTRGLSDIAAMGGEPIAAFLSLALPNNLPQTWVRRFHRGLLRLAQHYRVTLAGGDTAQSPHGVLADIVVLGTVPQSEAALRSGARPGDRVFVSGALGGSTAALLQLRTRGRSKSDERRYPRHFYPDPRLRLGRSLRERKIATAMIDTSDGLSTDLSHICKESGVGAEIEQSRIPRALVGNQAVDLDLALHGGEDYELLLTVSPGRHVPPVLNDVRLTEIGRITRGKKILLRSADGEIRELKPQGWEHFR